MRLQHGWVCSGFICLFTLRCWLPHSVCRWLNIRMTADGRWQPVLQPWWVAWYVTVQGVANFFTHTVNLYGVYHACVGYMHVRGVCVKIRYMLSGREFARSWTKHAVLTAKLPMCMCFSPKLWECAYKVKGCKPTFYWPSKNPAQWLKTGSWAAWQCTAEAWHTLPYLIKCCFLLSFISVCLLWLQM